MQRIGFILLLILLVVGNGITQNNNEKYLLYKKRLYSNFMLTHPTNQAHYGTWIPGHKRNPYDGFYNSGEIRWADAGHTIGYLLATLATEYAIISHKTPENRDITKCANDIANVLKTIERLDYVASMRYGQDSCCARDTLLPYPYNDNKLNGFFIRDDITHPASPIQQSSNEGLKDTPIIKSDFGKHDEMSQDQVWNLMQGLALTAKLVDWEEIYIGGNGKQVTLSEWAQTITLRLLNAMKTTYHIPLAWFSIPVRLWSITNPHTKQTVARGGKPIDLLLNASLFAKAGATILNTQPCNLQFGLQPSIKLALPLPGHKHFNDHAKLALAVIGKTQYAANFDEILYWSYRSAKSYNRGLPKSYQLFAYPHFPLMYLILHEDAIDTKNYFYHLYMSYLELRLNQAPAEGPWRSLFDNNKDGKIDKTDHPAPFWSAGKRLVKPTGKDYILNANDPATKPWEYNGLDYMLLYNLFELVKLQFFDMPAPKPLSEPYIYNKWTNKRGKQRKGVEKSDIMIFPDKNEKYGIPLNRYGNGKAVPMN